MRHRLVAILVAMTLLGGCMAPDAGAHAGVTGSSPSAGAALGGTPSVIQLSFSERAQASLSDIRVTDSTGAAYQSGRPHAVAGDPLSVEVSVRPLPRGVYTVIWRVDSAVDGHATTGAYAFGVQVAPASVPSTPRTTTPVSSLLELVARWIFLLGLIALIGGATAGVARFGGSDVAPVMLSAAGWLLSVIGVVMLAEAQRRSASSSIGALLHTPVGHALIWRAIAIGTAGAALTAAHTARTVRIRRTALLIAGLAALAAIAVHVTNGHAATTSWPSALTVSVQITHFAVAGVWIGGLAALLIGVRGAPSQDKAAAARRFSTIALVGLVTVATTGIVRAFSELDAWDQLGSTGYGRAILAKLALVFIIAGLGARNRRRSVPGAIADLEPLRRTSRAELSVGAGALAVAALLGTLAPPVAGLAGIRGLAAAGNDPTRSVRVALRTASDQPGPNRFVAGVQDYRSGDAVSGARVTLRFTPLDDPGTASTSLALQPAHDGTYAGSGANLAYDGRWRVTAGVERSGVELEVPLELRVPTPPQQSSVERIPGQDPKFTKLVGDLGLVRISPHPERAGPSELMVSFFTAALGDEEPIDGVIVTATAGHGPTRQEPVRRLGAGRFVAAVDLAKGTEVIAVVAHAAAGARLRSEFALRVPGR